MLYATFCYIISTSLNGVYTSYITLFATLMWKKMTDNLEIAWIDSFKFCMILDTTSFYFQKKSYKKSQSEFIALAFGWITRIIHDSIVFSYLIPNISLASFGVATSFPNSLMTRAARSTSSTLDVSWPLR